MLSNSVQKYDTITLRIGFSFWDCIFVVRVHNVLKQRYGYILFSFVTVTYSLLRHSCTMHLFKVVTFRRQNYIILCYVWIVYGNYVIKWQFFSCVILAYQTFLKLIFRKVTVSIRNLILVFTTNYFSSLLSLTKQ